MLKYVPKSLNDYKSVLIIWFDDEPFHWPIYMRHQASISEIEWQKNIKTVAVIFPGNRYFAVNETTERSVSSL